MIDLEQIILKDIGETTPYGDSRIDYERYDNILVLERYLDWLEYMRCELMSKLKSNSEYITRPEASMKNIAESSIEIYNNHILNETSIGVNDD